MSNKEIAQLFRNVAAALQIKNENRFRIIAYEKAADSIDNLTVNIKDLWMQNKLLEISGIGNIIADHIKELFTKGKVLHFESIFKDISPVVFEFLKIPGIGPKRADRLTREFKLNNPKNALNSLKKAIEKHKIAKLEGWGDKSEKELQKAVEAYEKGQIKELRMNLPFADKLANELIDYLSKIDGVKQIDVLGSLRRKVSTIGDIDLAVATNKPEKVIKAFVNYPQKGKIIDQGIKGATIRLKIGTQVDLRVQKPEAYGAMLQYFTGSKMHNIKLRELALKKGLSLSEYGIKIIDRFKIKDLRFKNFNKINNIFEFKNEKDFYNAIDLEWIPPELRENRGEIEAAFRQAQDKPMGLPKLVSLVDIKGDLHIHSDFNIETSHDTGASGLKELLENAVKNNYEYIGISNHNPSVLKHSPKQIVDLVKQQREKNEQIYTSWSHSVKKRVKIVHMLEVDINPNGDLAIPDEAFYYLDCAIVSIHSSFNQNQKDITKRIIKGLSHPKVKILGHPTGRLLNNRLGYDIDWMELFDFCIKNNKALEINSHFLRLDLPDNIVYEAVKKNVKLVINTDSHHKEQMNLMKYGVDVARRGWAEKKDILNTMGYNEILNWISK